jgi:hypothetical protein
MSLENENSTDEVVAKLRVTTGLDSIDGVTVAVLVVVDEMTVVVEVAVVVDK